MLPTIKKTIKKTMLTNFKGLSKKEALVLAGELNPAVKRLDEAHAVTVTVTVDEGKIEIAFWGLPISVSFIAHFHLFLTSMGHLPSLRTRWETSGEAHWGKNEVSFWERFKEWGGEAYPSPADKSLLGNHR